MRPGDVIAFAGKAPLSFLIDAWEAGKLSHVAMVKYGMTSKSDVLITESTIYADPATNRKVSGPQTHFLGDVLASDYSAKGSCAWLLQFTDEVYAQIDWPRFYAFIERCENGSVSYDIPGYFAFLLRSIPFLGARICQTPTYRRMFCSAYETAIVEYSGVPLHRDFSSTSPADVVRMKLYKTPPIQILGPATLIDSRFNSL